MGVGVNTQDWTTADLNRMTSGCTAARSAVYAATFHKLRGMAARLQNSESARHSCSPTELVQETFLRRLHGLRMRLEDRVHFLKVVRKLLVQTQLDISRHRRAQRRNQGVEAMPLESALHATAGREEPAILLRVALGKLKLISPLGARLLELKYFEQMNLMEMAEATSLSEWRVRVQLSAAERWLADYLPTNTIR